MKIKRNVVMAGLQLPMRQALKAADILWTRHGQELVVTSALEGEHSAGSYHYYGYAVDLRSRYFTDMIKRDIVVRLQRDLGPKGYTVIGEASHIHIQFNAG